MTEISFGDRALAHRLLACSAGDHAGHIAAADDATPLAAAGERALRELNDHLARWFGAEGADALLTRALDRTSTEFPVLATVARHAPGQFRLSGTAGDAATQGLAESPAALAEGLAALITAVVALLGRLVGDDMARRLVEQRWPEPDPRAAGSSRRSDSEMHVEAHSEGTGE